MLLVPLFLLTGCADSIGSVEPPKLAPAPISLTEPCARPVLLPDRELSQSEVERFWLRDRGSLITCAERQQALKDFYTSRDKKITGG